MREALPAQLLRARWGGAGAALVPYWDPVGTLRGHSAASGTGTGAVPPVCTQQCWCRWIPFQ